jgi:hypothetical protein
MIYNCWPDNNQELLLKSCFSPKDDSYVFWEKWLNNLKSPLDISNKKNTLKSLFDQIDLGSQRLLPLLYRKITKVNPDDPIIKSIKGYYLYSWYRNQVLLQKLKNVLSRFKPFNIEIIVLKGIPLSILYYKDLGTRPMSDFDIVVKPENINFSLSLLQSDGWIDLRTGKPFINAEGLLGNARALIDPDNTELDFHWKLFKETYDSKLDKELWENKIQFRIEDLNIFTLNPTDHLLKILVHGLEGNEVPSIRWIADAIVVIQSEKIDWDLLIERAIKRRMTPFIKESIKYLDNKFKDLIPAEVIEKTKRVNPSVNEVRYYRQRLKPNPAGSINMLLLRHFQYRLNAANQSLITELKDFYLHYKKNWGIEKNLFLFLYYIILRLLKIQRYPINNLKSGK